MPPRKPNSAATSAQSNEESTAANLGGAQAGSGDDDAQGVSGSTQASGGESTADTGAEAAAKSPERMVKVRILAKCAEGAVNSVISLPASVVENLVKAGYADDNESAVKYAESNPEG